MRRNNIIFLPSLIEFFFCSRHLQNRAALDNQEPFFLFLTGGINQVGRSKTGNAGDVLIKDVCS